jgi:hypothetical protein
MVLVVLVMVLVVMVLVMLVMVPVVMVLLMLLMVPVVMVLVMLVMVLVEMVLLMLVMVLLMMVIVMRCVGAISLHIRGFCVMLFSCLSVVVVMHSSYSFLTTKIWTTHLNYVGMGGMNPAAIQQQLMQNPDMMRQIMQVSVCLCVCLNVCACSCRIPYLCYLIISL